MELYVRASLEEAQDALKSLLADKETQAAIARAGDLLAATFKKGGRVFSCGNGGSMCDAMHFAEELSGRYRLDRPALAAVAISDAGYVSCVGNDYGYDHVFARYLEAHARSGDVLLAISTSGKSKNILAAAATAKKLGVTTIGLTGRAGAPLAAACDSCIATPAGKFADRVQELHIKVIHILIELIERQMFPENY
jgi:D-sedoheptulose 7-phosphate isomerase